MIPADTIRKLFAYYYWARDAQLAACEALGEEQFTRELGGSFASVRDTFTHLLVAEWAWNSRWHRRPLGNVPDPKDIPAVAGLRQRWEPVEAGVGEFLSALTDDALVQPFSFTNMQGKENTCELWQTFYHFVNHQSYHRGQITNQLRQLGAEPPSVDYVTRYLQSRA